MVPGGEVLEGKNTEYFVFYFLYFFANAFVYPYLGLILAYKGMDGVATGVILAFFNVAVVVATLFTAYHVDRGSPAKLILYLLVAGAVVATAGLGLGNTFLPLLVATMVFGGFTFPTNDIVDKSLMDRLGAEPERYSSFRLGGSLGYALGIIGAAFVLESLGVTALLYAFVLFSLLNLLVIRSMPIDIESVKETVRFRFRPFFADHRYVPFLVVVLFGLSDSGIGQFLSLHFVSLELNPANTSLFISVAMIGEIVAFGLLSRLIRRLGVWLAVAIGFLIQFLRLLAISATGRWPFVLVVFFQALGGAAFALIYAAITQIVSENYEPGLRTLAHSAKTVAFKGIGSSLGVLFFGIMYKYASTATAFLIFSWFALATFAGLVLIVYFLGPEVRERGRR